MCGARWCELSGIRQHSGSPLCWWSHTAESLCRWAAVGDFSYTATLRRRHICSLEITYRAFNRADAVLPPSCHSFFPTQVASLLQDPYFTRLLGWTLALNIRCSVLWSLPSHAPGGPEFPGRNHLLALFGPHPCSPSQWAPHPVAGFCVAVRVHARNCNP